MLTFCVETTYFGMKSDVYQQEEVLAIGLPLSPEMTNIYMERDKRLSFLDVSITHSEYGFRSSVY